jgi:hypothetical protein
VRSRLAAGALIVLSAFGCGGGSGGQALEPVTGSVTAASIWFHPIPSASAWPNGPTTGVGSTDFLSLFAANAPWQNTLAHTSVIGLYAGWVATATIADLQQVVNFINLHHLGIELEAPAMEGTATCGTGVEGYLASGTLQSTTLQYLQRLKAAGGNLTSIKVDEPLFFGVYTSDSRSCHFSVTQVAQDVGTFTALVKSVYPNAIVGDVEPVIENAGYTPDVVTAIGQWDDTYQSVNGASLPYYIADPDYSNPSWPTLVKSLETATRARGMRFGIIYMGDPTDTTDAQWTAKAVSRAQTYEQQNGGRPDYALFQSWMERPKLTLPETDPTTFTGAINTYITSR